MIYNHSSIYPLSPEDAQLVLLHMDVYWLMVSHVFQEIPEREKKQIISVLANKSAVNFNLVHNIFYFQTVTSHKEGQHSGNFGQNLYILFLKSLHIIIMALYQLCLKIYNSFFSIVFLFSYTYFLKCWPFGLKVPRLRCSLNVEEKV